MIEILDLNNRLVRQVRLQYLKLVEAYQASSSDSYLRQAYLHAFGYPDDLPDLAALRPPGNARSEGVAECHQRRLEGRLPEMY